MEIADIPQGAFITTYKASALRFLELLRKEVTGTRSLLMPLGSNPLILGEKELGAELALEVYLDREEAWVVSPETFFKSAA